MCVCVLECHIRTVNLWEEVTFDSSISFVSSFILHVSRSVFRASPLGHHSSILAYYEYHSVLAFWLFTINNGVYKRRHQDWLVWRMYFSLLYPLYYINMLVEHAKLLFCLPVRFLRTPTARVRFSTARFHVRGLSSQSTHKTRTRHTMLLVIWEFLPINRECLHTMFAYQERKSNKPATKRRLRLEWFWCILTSKAKSNAFPIKAILLFANRIFSISTITELTFLGHRSAVTTRQSA